MNMSYEAELLRSRMSQRLMADADLLGRGISDTDSHGLHEDGGSSDGSSVSECPGQFECTADVGCDHGYVSMYLVMTGISRRALAMDVRKGPLSAARSNVEEFGLSDRVELRLSDGLSELSPGDADSLIIAGMGGKLMVSILDKRDVRALGIRMGVLQPQSDIPEFREYLRSRGYSICDERVLCEDGKYYFPMLVDFDPVEDKWAEAVMELSEEIRKVTGDSSEAQSDRGIAVRVSDRYGVFNILRRERVLLTYLEHGAEVLQSILRNLDEREHSGRYREVTDELSDIELLLKLFG